MFPLATPLGGLVLGVRAFYDTLHVVFSVVMCSLCTRQHPSCRPSINDIVTVLEDLNECLNGTPDSSMLMRNASLKRVAKGSYMQGFAAPPSLIKQSNTARTTSALPLLAKGNPESGSASRLLLEMIHSSGLIRDRDLKKRLKQTGAEDLIRIAGLQPGVKRVPKRLIGGPSVRATKAPTAPLWTPDIQLIPREMQLDGSIEVVGVAQQHSPEEDGLKNAYTETLKVMNSRHPTFMRAHKPM